LRTRLIIDTIVQQTTILIAELATAAGMRAPLSHVANQVFLELARAIEAQGVPRKVAADMFGLALRSYQLKVQRLEESSTDRDRSLWEAIYEFVRQSTVISRAEILKRFRHDDGASVRSILNDLVETGLVFQTGTGHGVAYRAASDEEMAAMASRIDAEALEWVVWITLYRSGPRTVGELAGELGCTEAMIDDALAALTASGRVLADGQMAYRCERCHIPLDESAGWGAAVIDHYRALVVAMGQKLREKAEPTLPPEVVGGSTYSFDLYDGHPHEEEALELLAATRQSLSELRAKVCEHNDSVGREKIDRKVTFYFGQSVIDVDDAAVPQGET
jgi:hypothetical protein